MAQHRPRALPPLLPLLALLLAVAALAGAARASSCQGCSASSPQGRERRDIVFPGEHEDDFDPITRYLSPQQIEHLNNLDSLDDLPKFFPNRNDVEPPIVSARILPQLSSRSGAGPAGQARKSGAKKPVAAKCRPILQPVPLNKPDDLSLTYWPACILLERCGGCCYNERQMSCQPTKTEIVTYEVQKLKLNTMQKNGTDLLNLERHVECYCRCIVKAEDCNALQEYDPLQCRCNCGNADEKRKCLSQSNKLWDYNECKCRCREYPEEGCTFGLFFDPNTCTCAALPDSRRHPDSTGTYKLETRRRRWQNKTSNAFTRQ